ncbi:hypothetical protein Enr17x_23360 [Gimesia fumaroli]|jgi:hypothetical protein|uniref:Uncharacterized protein n=1 Tax=Gimesia fumaroli TaxID=2527976 RepID=A0A518IB14_9PLAN|nr:hypothetical protein Enr17x_23360 [Gimesia fumaroli]
MKIKKRIFHFVFFTLTFFTSVFLILIVFFDICDLSSFPAPYGMLILTVSFFGSVALPMIVVIILPGED